VRLAFSPPISQQLTERYPVHLSDYDVKTFFEFPLKEIPNSATRFLDSSWTPMSIDDTIKTCLGLKIREQSKKMVKILRSSRLLFNAVKYNAPLTLFYEEIVEWEDDVQNRLLTPLKTVLETFEEMTNIERKGNSITLSRLKMDKTMIINTVLTLSLTSSLEENIGDKLKGTMPTISNILGIFQRVYRIPELRMNEIFLRIELKKIEKNGCRLKEGEKKLLKELLYEQQLEIEKSKREYSSSEKRNFFAHSGLLRHLVYVKKVGEELLLEYDRNKLRTIKSWLDNPEGKIAQK